MVLSYYYYYFLLTRKQGFFKALIKSNVTDRDGINMWLCANYCAGDVNVMQKKKIS